MRPAIPRPWIVMLVGLASLVTSVAAAQTDVDRFLARAREGTASFRDLQAAIAAGYRPVGQDAPGMGQHWVQPRMVIEGEYDPAHPAILTYISINGVPTLVGLAYAIAFRPGDRLPVDAVSPEAWHVHRGMVAEEGALFGHHMTPVEAIGGTGVAMLHAWVWLENPDGLFTPDNWALPFVRRGLGVPRAPPHVLRQAALALSLPREGAPFYAEQLTRHVLLSPEDRDTAHRVLTGCSAEVEGWLSVERGPSLSDGEVAWLAERWEKCRGKLETAVSHAGRVGLARAVFPR